MTETTSQPSSERERRLRQFRDRWGIASQQEADDLVKILQVVMADTAERHAIQLLGRETVLAAKANQTES